MDVETASALERVIERVDALDTSLSSKIVDLGQEIAALREGVAEVRRHAVILNESTREDIRFVAEAVADLTVKIDSRSR